MQFSQQPARLSFRRALRNLAPVAPFNGCLFTELEIKQFQTLLHRHRDHPHIADLVVSQAQVGPKHYFSRLALISPDKRPFQTVHKITNTDCPSYMFPTLYRLGEDRYFEGYKFYCLIQEMDRYLQRSVNQVAWPALKSL